MNSLPFCPCCGARGWQRNVYLRYEAAEYIEVSEEEQITVVRIPEDPKPIEVTEKTRWACEACAELADPSVDKLIDLEYEAEETQTRRDPDLDEWGNVGGAQPNNLVPFPDPRHH
jgi:hypothetical protein